MDFYLSVILFQVTAVDCLTEEDIIQGNTATEPLATNTSEMLTLLVPGGYTHTNTQINRKHIAANMYKVTQGERRVFIEELG